MNVGNFMCGKCGSPFRAACETCACREHDKLVAAARTEGREEGRQEERERVRGVLFTADMLEKYAEDQDEWCGPAQALFAEVKRLRDTDSPPPQGCDCGQAERVSECDCGGAACSCAEHATTCPLWRKP